MMVKKRMILLFLSLVIVSCNENRQKKIYLTNEKRETVLETSLIDTLSIDAQLFEAAKSGNETKVKLLLSQGANPDARGVGYGNHDENGVVLGSDSDWTALMIAAHYNHLKVMKILVEAGATVTAFNTVGYTALHYGTQNGYEDLSFYLLEHGAAQYDRSLASSGILLYNALLYGRKDLANTLIDSGENIHYINPETGRSNLIESFYNQLPKVGMRIAELGANVNQIGTKYGETALMWAARYNYLNAVHLLVEKGAKVNMQDPSYYTAIAFAASNKHDDTAITKLLLAKGAILNPADRQGRTALIEAAGCKNINIAQLLLARGADPNQQAEFFGFISPLREAVFDDNLQMSKLLIENGADVNLTTNNGSSILLEAVYNEQNLEIVKILLANGAKINLANDDGETPLLKSISYNHPKMIKFLMQHGANIHAIDGYGRDAIKLATERKDTKLLKLVKSYYN